MLVNDIFEAAVGHHQAGRFQEAAALYQQLLAAEPDNLAALNNLGMLVSPEQALALFERALTLWPNYVDAHLNVADALMALDRLDEAVPHYEAVLDETARAGLSPRADVLSQLGAILLGLGRLDDALLRLRQAVAIKPDVAATFHNLGCVLQRLGRLDESIPYYEKALAYDPGLIATLYNLGTVHITQRRYADAEKFYRWALAIDPSDARDPSRVQANLNLVVILESEGRFAEAAVYRRRTDWPVMLEIEPAPAPKRTVLVLMSKSVGNVPHELLLPRQTTTRIKWYVDYADDDQEETLPPYDVAFNAVGSADAPESCLTRIKHFNRTHPLLNSAEAVERTRRDQMPALLSGIPDLMVPAVARLRRDEVLEPGLAERLLARGLTCPLIVRPWCTHGGEGMDLIETPEQLPAAKYSDSDGFYFIGYQDYRSTDGFFRKYRMLFIDREPYAYHLAISPNWLVHYISAEMAAHDWKRNEEKSFLANPLEQIGPKAMAAIAAVGRRMDLDYAGIDFSLTPDGKVLVFEANATMSLYQNEATPDYEYKARYVAAMAGAFERLLDRRSA